MSQNEFHTIPGFSRYQISKKGVIIDTQKNNRVIPLSHSSSGYLSCMLYADNGLRQGVFLHRLLMLTFCLPTNQDVSQLVVDHIDGNRLNNDLSNLEWVSRSSNCSRAGYRQTTIKSVPVILTNTITGEEKQYDTITACGNTVGLHKDTLRNWLSHGPDYVSPQGYKLRRLYATKDNQRVHNSRETVVDSYKKRVSFRNLFTDEEFAVESITAAAYILRMSLSAFSHRFDLMKHPVWYEGWQLKYSVDEREWRECDYWNEIQLIMPRCPVVERIDLIDKVVIRYESIKYASFESLLPINTIRRMIKTQGSVLFNKRNLWGIFPIFSNNLCPMEKQFSIEKLPNCKNFLKLIDHNVTMK